MDEFQKELAELINKHSIENEVDIPDFILAKLIVGMIEAMGWETDYEKVLLCAEVTAAHRQLAAKLSALARRQLVAKIWNV